MPEAPISAPLIAPIEMPATKSGCSADSLRAAYLTGPDQDRPAVERAAAFSTRALLAEAISQGAFGEPIPSTALHGLTLLLVDRLVGPSDRPDELSETLLEGMIDGLATRIPSNPASCRRCRNGFQIMMNGEGDVVSGWQNKLH